MLPKHKLSTSPRGSFSLAVQHHAFADQNTAVRPRLAGHDDGVGPFCALVKSVTLDLRERPVSAFLMIDDFLELLLDFRNLIRIIHDCHSQGRLVDTVVEGNQTQTSLQGGWSRDSVQPDKSFGHRNSRKVRVDDREIISVSHRS